MGSGTGVYFSFPKTGVQALTLEPTQDSQRRRLWHPTPLLFPGKSHEQRSLVGCSPWGHEESDTTKQLPFHFSFSCIGEGNGNPLQCSCLENPRHGGAWWVAIYGVAQSRTRLKRLSSGSSSSREAWRAAIHGVAKSWTRLSDWTEPNWATNTFSFQQHDLRI